jgi:cytochrome c oxidase subunit 3
MSSHHWEADVAERWYLRELGMWMFLGTLVMLFAAFTSAMVVRRAGSDWRTLDLPSILWVSTVFIVSSSGALEYGRRRSLRSEALAGVGAAAALGLLFLTAQLLAWGELVRRGVYLPTSPDASFFYMLTGVHAVHLVAALAVVAWLFGSLVRNARPSEWRRLAGVAAAFWHFLAGTWIYLFVILSWI